MTQTTHEGQAPGTVCLNYGDVCEGANRLALGSRAAGPGAPTSGRGTRQSVPGSGP